MSDLDIIAASDHLGALIDELERRELRTADLALSSRQLNHWEESGLLFTEATRQDTKQWRSFSLTDFHWVRIVHALREWNIPFDSILALRENFECQIGASSEHSKPCSLITALLAEFVITRVGINVLVTDTKQLFLFNPSAQDVLDPDFLAVIQRPHLSVPLMGGFVEQALAQGKRAQRLHLQGLLSSGEQGLLKALRMDRVAEITLRRPDLPPISIRRCEHASYNEMLESACRLMLEWPYESLHWASKEGPATNLIFTPWLERRMTEGNGT